MKMVIRSWKNKNPVNFTKLVYFFNMIGCLVNFLKMFSIQLKTFPTITNTKFVFAFLFVFASRMTPNWAKLFLQMQNSNWALKMCWYNRVLFFPWLYLQQFSNISHMIFFHGFECTSVYYVMINVVSSLKSYMHSLKVYFHSETEYLGVPLFCKFFIPICTS